VLVTGRENKEAAMRSGIVPELQMRSGIVPELQMRSGIVPELQMKAKTKNCDGKCEYEKVS